jgi:hypothetical protein
MALTFHGEGYWWPPARPDARVFGSVHFSPEAGAILTAKGGALDGIEGPIFGELLDGKPTTLLQVIWPPACPFPALPLRTITQTYHATILIVGGHHVPQAGGTVFGGICAELPQLRHWLGKGPINANHGEECLTLAFKWPQTIDLVSQGSRNISARYGYLEHFSFADRFPVKLHLSSSVVIRAISDMEKQVRDLTHFCHFLTLALDEQVWPSSIHLLPIKDSGCEFLSLYYQPIGKPVVTHRQPKYPLFTLQDLAGRESAMLEHWFAMQDTLAPVFSLYFSVLYTPSAYRDVQLFNLVQALEVFHRVTTGRKQTKLATRLRELVGTFSEVLRPVLPPGVDAAAELRDHRDYMAHFNEADQRKHAHGHRVAFLGELAKLLVQLCLLKHLTFTAAEVRATVIRGRAYKLLGHWADRQGDAAEDEVDVEH